MSQVDFNSHDAPVRVLAFFSCRCTCAMPPWWSTWRPLETGRRKEEEEKKEGENRDWTSINKGKGRAEFQKMMSWASPLGRGLLATGGSGFL